MQTLLKVNLFTFQRNLIQNTKHHTGHDNNKAFLFTVQKGENAKMEMKSESLIEDIKWYLSAKMAFSWYVCLSYFFTFIVFFYTYFIVQIYMVQGVPG